MMEKDTENKKKGFGQKLQDFMASYRGQVIMNYAYCWGAAIVIAGTLFKLTHLAGADIMLWIGMGTEVLVFFISAFDLPNKQVGASVGGVIMMGGAPNPSAAGNSNEQYQQQGGVPAEEHQQASGHYADGAATQGMAAGGTIYVGGGGYPAPSGGYPAPSSGGLTPSVPPAVNAEMEETTQAYVAQLKEMTEMLSRFTAQAGGLSLDAEQMNAMNRNLTEINAIYEMQLRGAGTQINTLDKVHEQTRKMARQIEELNELYARMLQAMQAR